MKKQKSKTPKKDPIENVDIALEQLISDGIIETFIVGGEIKYKLTNIGNSVAKNIANQDPSQRN